MKATPTMKTFFWNILRILIEFIFFAIFAAIVIAAIMFPMTYLLGINIEELSGHEQPFTETLVNYIPTNIGFIFAIFLLRKFLFIRPFSEAGFGLKGLLSDTYQGFLWGVGLIVLGFASLFFLQKIATEGYNWNPHLFFGFLLMFFFQSFSEEVLSRSFMLPALSHYFGKIAALIVSSGIFSALHFSNPNFNIIGGINVFLAGIAMGIFFLKYKNVWACTGLHWGWNFMQATFFDFNVSGMDVYSFVEFQPLEPAWLSGGLFGFEGSVLSVVFLIVFSIYFGKDIEWLKKTKLFDNYQ